MKKILCAMLALGVVITMASCATTPVDQTKRAPAFLDNYNLLKPVNSPEGTQVYMYKNSDIDRNNYNSAIIEPVSLYQTAVESGVTSAQIEKARTDIESGIKQIVSHKIKITNKAGPGVARIKVAITGATLEKDSLKPWNIIPISAAIRLASAATGLDNKKPAMVVEIKIVDSQSGRLIKEVVSTISGEEFRMESNTPDEFDKLAIEWVKQALKYSR